MKRLVILATLILAGCVTPYWQTDMPGYRVQHIEVVQAADWRARCQRYDAIACAVRLRASPTTLIYVQPGLNDEQWACVLAHEARHAGGANHDSRPIYRSECSI